VYWIPQVIMVLKSDHGAARNNLAGLPSFIVFFEFGIFSLIASRQH